MWSPSGPSTWRIVSTSDALRMKDAKTMSTPFSTPKRRALTSTSETAGRSTCTLGRFTPLWLLSLLVLKTRALTKSGPSSVTLRHMSPSSTKMLELTRTTLGRFL